MEYLSLKKDGMVGEIQINRPPANALSSGLIEELDSILNEIESDKEIRVVLLYGDGRFFSAGADIKEFTTIPGKEEFSVLSQRGQNVFERIESFSKPVIAAIHGAALGGGLELAMSCHIRLVTEKAKLGLPELSLGLIPGFAGTQRLPRYVGIAKAMEMLLTSKPITGSEAVQLGLANHAYDEEQLLPNARKLAQDISKKSPATMKASIELMSYAKQAKFSEGVSKEAELFGEVFVTNDAKEGIQAFIEKREAVFKGE
ncbi:enoyl-CoA hydratase [Oikeobacillus pervagus]|uniref:Enoyl-CoA hydratase n=1 Tax=Oikeobacillus pervagus TaxID=1325931 RepID=A0AAJ1WJ90_9BACI|nr:enoyl-CoA hydratase [Oikeobacillus pervagus]MDQ0215445.1 enoyl-CoA hydratase [Oikeobacillus pervagus]